MQYRMEQNNNFLIPKHKKLSDEEVQVIIDKYNLNSKMNLPKIKSKDAALVELDVVAGDVVEITRNDFAGETKYFRVVVD